jgi:hypothetical protein
MSDTTPPLVIWKSQDLCLNGTCHFESCNCPECPRCESVHAGACVWMSDAAEDRRTLERAAA